MILVVGMISGCSSMMYKTYYKSNSEYNHQINPKKGPGLILIDHVYNNESLTEFNPSKIDYSTIADFFLVQDKVTSEMKENQYEILDWKTTEAVFDSMFNPENKAAYLKALGQTLELLNTVIKEDEFKDNSTEIRFLDFSKNSFASTKLNSNSIIYYVIGLESLKKIVNNKNYLGSMFGVFCFDWKGMLIDIQVFEYNFTKFHSIDFYKILRKAVLKEIKK